MCAIVDDEFSYDENAENGPANWGKIWRDCSGHMQSPIDLLNKGVEVSNSGILQKHYKPARATLSNRGHDMMLRWDGDAGYLKINGTQYQLQQVHWHTPSEHTIDGKRFDMEAHLVHISNGGNIAVIGILYEIGLLPDTLLTITTPPCTEGVVWTIGGKVKSVTRRQIKLLQDAVADGFEFNARPIQPLNGRPIKFNKPWPSA
ncbi:hypothetical protein HAX54_042331 [Datura stramonium]|uniref:Carbonic anhydrase n=1 Tax=Datura stramonium TaxID=4076 RepID=A0ABS8W2B0_DATST|nr:hypothetical protein [Datura stramonium]